jgi:hypothetical protein
MDLLALMFCGLFLCRPSSLTIAAAGGKGSKSAGKDDIFSFSGPAANRELHMA